MTDRPTRAAVVPPDEEDDGGPPLFVRGWRLTVLGLHVVFALLVTIAVVTIVLSPFEAPKAVLLVPLGVLAVAYALFGAPALAPQDQRRAAVYLTVLVLVFGVLAWFEPSLLFLLFLGYAQVWFLSATVLRGVLWTLALATASTVGPFVSWTRGDEPLSGPAQTLVGLTFSLAMGFWIFQVLEQSRQRALLIRALERTRAELATAERERGVLAERERLAREVHDTLAQGYTSIVVLAQTASAQLPAGADATRDRLALIEEVARDNLQEARAVVAAFAPVALEGSTLVEALERLAERFGRETGLAVRVDTAALDGAVALRRDEEVVLLRGAQEALTNVRRHADATSVAIRISAVGEGDARHVSVHVEDDGVGFDPAYAHGSGLDGLRGRVASVGGEVDVASSPGAGTRVTVRVPGS
jgi:signal transduction histidine kinase